MVNATWLYVGAIYAVAVWLARRAGIDLPRRIALFFYLIVFVFMRNALTRAVVNLPIDFLQILPPWTSMTRIRQVQNRDINDVVLQIVPWAHQVRESWKAFHIPLWNHLSGAGYPLLANGQSSALSPLRLLALPLPLGQSFACEAAMKFLIALTFTFLLCRRRGYSALASASGAVCFAFSTFLIVWLHFPLTTVAAFVPAALYQIDLLAERITYPRFAFTVGLWTSMIFGGHPETVAHIFFLSLLYLSWILLVERSRRWRDARTLLLAGGLALALAAMLAAPLLAPFAEALTKSKRFHELQVAPNPIGIYSDWRSIVLLIQPHFYGQLPAEKPWGPATAESITGFAGILGIAAWFAVLADVIRNRKWRSREAFFVTATFVVVGVMLGWRGLADVFHFVFHLAANARLRLLLCFLLAVLTAAFFDLAERKAWLPMLAGVFAASALVLFTVTTMPFANAWRRDTAVLSLMPSVLVLLIAASLPLAMKYRRYLLMALTVAMIAELWTVDRGWNPDIRDALMYPSTPLLRALDDLKSKQPANTPFRIVGAGPAFFVNVPAVYGFEDIRAHDPMANGRYLGVLRVLTGYATDDYFAKWENFKTTLLDFLNVKYVVTPPRADLHDPERFQMLYDGPDGRIFHNVSVLPRFYPVRNVILEFKNDLFVQRLKNHSDWLNTAIVKSLPVENDQNRRDLLAPRAKGTRDATLTLTETAGDHFRMHVDAPRYTLIVSSIPWWPGWKVMSGNQRITPIHVNGAFIGFTVPPGQHDLRVWYSPMTFWTGTWISIATLIGLIAGPWFMRRRVNDPRDAAGRSAQRAQ